MNYYPPHKKITEIFNGLLKNGGKINFIAKGRSMAPAILDGDVVEVLRIDDKMKLKKGDLVLYRDEEDNPVIHRIVQASPVLIVKADNARLPDSAVSYDNLIGKVIAIKRGMKIIRPATSKTKIVFAKIVYKIKKLFNPEFLVPEQKKAIVSVREKYNQEEEVNLHRTSVNEGLEEWEEYFFRKYMNKKGKVLDIGCGAGREAIALAKLGFEVIGIDISDHMIKAAIEESKSYDCHIHFDVCSVMDIDKYEPSKFDYIIFTRAMYSYIPGKNLRIAVLKKAKGLLKDTGFLAVSGYIVKEIAVSSFLRRTIISRIYGLKNKAERGDFMVETVSPASSKGTCFCHFFANRDEIRNEIETAGLKVIELWKDNFWILQ